MASYLSCDKGGVTCLSHDRGNPITVEPPMKDTLKEDEPLHTLYKITLQKEDNLSTKDKKTWSQMCPLFGGSISCIVIHTVMLSIQCYRHLVHLDTTSPYQLTVRGTQMRMGSHSAQTKRWR